MDLFGRKARAELEALKVAHQQQEDCTTRFTRGLQAQLEEALKAKSFAVKRCFDAEDLMQEFVSATIPTANLRSRAKTFLSGNSPKV